VTLGRRRALPFRRFGGNLAAFEIGFQGRSGPLLARNGLR